MPTTPRKTAATKAAKLATPAAAEPDEATDLDALRGEVRANPDTTDKPFPVPFADTKITVKAILDWPVSSDKLLFTSQFTEWAEKILDGDQFTDVWVPTDPTLRQVVKFVQDLEAATGIPFGLQFTSPSS